MPISSFCHIRIFNSFMCVLFSKLKKTFAIKRYCFLLVLIHVDYVKNIYRLIHRNSARKTTPMPPKKLSSYDFLVVKNGFNAKASSFLTKSTQVIPRDIKKVLWLNLFRYSRASKFYQLTTIGVSHCFEGEISLLIRYTPIIL